MKVYQHLYSSLLSLWQLEKRKDVSSYRKMEAYITSLVEAKLPRGSGFDVAPSLVWKRCKKERMLLEGHYHTMNDNGFYTGWISFYVSLSPSFLGPNIVVRGKMSPSLRDYIEDTYREALEREMR